MNQGQSQWRNAPHKRPLPPLVLWLGVLIADWCIMAPILLIGAMMSSGWVGGSSHPETFWRIVIPSLAVLSVLSTLVLFVWRHFRWLYWIVLGGIAIVSWVNAKELFRWMSRPTEECGIGLFLAVTGLFLSVLSAVLIASSKAKNYYAALADFRRMRTNPADR